MAAADRKSVDKRYRNVRRVDYDARCLHGWLVMVQRHHKITRQFFADSHYKGKRLAFEAALNFRDDVIRKSAVRHQLWRRNVLRRNNRSGIAGVSRHVAIDRRPGGGRYAYWVASWNDAYGKHHQRKFSVLRHGEDKAKELATQERARQLRATAKIKRGWFSE